MHTAESLEAVLADPPRLVGEAAQAALKRHLDAQHGGRPLRGDVACATVKYVLRVAADGTTSAAIECLACHYRDPDVRCFAAAAGVATRQAWTDPAQRARLVAAWVAHVRDRPACAAADVEFRQVPSGLGPSDYVACVACGTQTYVDDPDDNP